MPTTKPRINVTLPEEVNQTVVDLANLQGVSSSHVVRQLLIEANSAMREVVQIMEKSEYAQEQLCKQYLAAHQLAIQEFDATLSQVLGNRRKAPAEKNAA